MNITEIARNLTRSEFQSLLNVMNAHWTTLENPKEEDYGLDTISKIVPNRLQRSYEVHFINGKRVNYTLDGNWF